MKKLLAIILLSFSFAQADLYFSAFQKVIKGKRLLHKDPKRANIEFIEAAGYLKQLINNSIEVNKPNANALKLLGEMYLKGWGIEQNYQEAEKLLCAAANYGNLQAQKLIKRNNFICTKISLKELKQ
jgi:TPR repeat protein